VAGMGDRREGAGEERWLKRLRDQADMALIEAYKKIKYAQTRCICNNEQIKWKWRYIQAKKRRGNIRIWAGKHRHSDIQAVASSMI